MQTIGRPQPDSSISVAPFVGRFDGDQERLVRVAGLEQTDYLTPAEARELARALDAAALKSSF